MNLEDELRKALTREQPPGDFAARMTEKLRSARPAPTEKLRAARQTPRATPSEKHWIAGLALAASLAFATGGALYYARQQERAEAERVRAGQARAEQLRNDAVIGLRIASAKLNDVSERLQRRSTASPASTIQNERTR